MRADPTLDRAPAVAPRGAAATRILSLCCVYPNPLQPGQGIFVQRRLQHLSELTDVMVVAPFALVQYGNQNGNRLRIGESRCPARAADGNMTILHPRWF